MSSLVPVLKEKTSIADFSQNGHIDPKTGLPIEERLTTFPLVFRDLWKHYQTARSCFWQPGEIVLNKDLVDWRTALTKEEKHYIKYIIAFFAASDGIVNLNLATKFRQEVRITEAIYFYDFQIMMEDIHAETYSILLDFFAESKKEKLELFDSINKLPAVKRKAEWSFKWIESSESFAERLIAFAAVEGIFFSGSFCSIYWLRNRGLLAGLGQSNELIARDEGLHCKFACELFKLIHPAYRPTSERVLEIILSAVDCEYQFIEEALPKGLPRMNSVMMKEHIQSVANDLLIMLGLPPYFKIVTSPFDFMQQINIKNKSNFFEVHPTEYKKIDKNASISNIDKDTGSLTMLDNF